MQYLPHNPCDRLQKSWIPMASLSDHLHFLLVPLMSQSHLIPFTQMAKLFSSHGVTVTIILTPLNAARFDSFIHQAQAFDLKIHVLSFPFPSSQVGLPQGCENIDSLPSPESVPLFFAASNLLQQPLENWLAELKTLPSCIISDLCLPWTSNVASRFNIPRVVFHGISCFTLLCSHCITQSKVHERVVSMSEPFVVPDFPHRIELTKAQLPEATIQQSGALDEFKRAELSGQGILMNTFQELEELYVKGYEKVVKKIWCIGPLYLSDRLISNKFGIRRDHENSIDDNSDWLKFLNSHKPCSVIYVCFGSLCRFETPQLKELALGLEASNSPFIWVIKKSDFSAELEKWVEEERYEEKIKGRGLVIKGWAPQVEILSHGAIGGFITHCGWNSTLEGVSAGVPMITWPMFAEQFYNEKLIVEVVKMGVKIGADGGLVRKEQVKDAIEKMIEEGKGGAERRRRAREVAEMARKTMEEEGSSHLNCKSFIQHIMAQVSP